MKQKDKKEDSIITPEMLVDKFGFSREDMADLGEHIGLVISADLSMNLNDGTIWIGEHDTRIKTAKELEKLISLLTNGMIVTPLPANREVFDSINLPLGGTATVLEGRASDWFYAMDKSKGETGSLIKHMILRTVLIDGEPIKEEYLVEMKMNDMLAITEVISAMLQPTNNI